MTKTLSDLEVHGIHLHAKYQSDSARGSEVIIRKQIVMDGRTDGQTDRVNPLYGRRDQFNILRPEQTWLLVTDNIFNCN